MRVLIVGLSTRAIAQSAYEAGHDIVTLDYFGDSDQRALVENHSLLRDYDLPYGPEALVRVGRELDAQAVVYTAGLENDPWAVADLAEGRTLLGNEPDVLCQVRNWDDLRGFFRDAGISFAETLLPGEEGLAEHSERWVRKPVRSGGGHRVDYWDGSALARHQILQAYVDGVPASAAFVADGEDSLVIGMTEQLIGREELGAAGFAWCGNVVPLELKKVDREIVWHDIATAISRMTKHFRLRGVNGVDFVLHRCADGRPRPVVVEVNPRYTASMELFESAYDESIFSLHVEAVKGYLPASQDRACRRWMDGCLGKAIVYAKRPVTMPDTGGWFGLGRRDVPHTGERIEAGHPVCTVFARGNGRRGCWSGLVEAADSVRREIGDQTGGVTWTQRSS